MREVADGVVALAADRAQRRGLVLEEPVAEDAAARGQSLSSWFIKRPERGEAAAQVEVLLLERLHLLVEDADQLVDMLDAVAQLVVVELAGEYSKACWVATMVEATRGRVPAALRARTRVAMDPYSLRLKNL